MLEKISIKLARFDDDGTPYDIVNRKACAWVDGVFAIHRSVERYSDVWTLTHLPTGGRITRGDRGKVIDALHTMKTAKLGGTLISELKACDMVEFRNEIVEQNGLSSRTIHSQDEYTKLTKPRFEAILGC